MVDASWMWEERISCFCTSRVPKNFPWVTKQNHILHVAIKDNMLMITPTTLTLVKKRKNRELFKSIDEKMLKIKLRNKIKERDWHMQKNFLCGKHLAGMLPRPWACLHACFQGQCSPRGCNQGFHSPWASYLGHGSLMWARNQGLACVLALSQGHGSPCGHEAKGKATLVDTLPRENQNPIN